MRIAAIGECMMELSGKPAEGLRLGYGGDTLNTAIYLARLGVPIDYITALGDDPFSASMIAAWREEGVGVDKVVRIKDRMPGLYMISVDEKGDRRFFYWRDRAPARDIFSLSDTAAVLDSLSSYDWIYLSGISLSLYGDDGRAKLNKLLDMARANGAKVAFDSNYRPAGWSSVAAAREAYDNLRQRCDLALSGIEDEEPLYGDQDAMTVVHRLRASGIAEISVKTGDTGSVVWTQDMKSPVAVKAEIVPQVVDTTAAGDSFNAGYLAARLMQGRDGPAAAKAGHKLAASVIQHRGAIIPREAMPNEE